MLRLCVPMLAAVAGSAGAQVVTTLPFVVDDFSEGVADISEREDGSFVSGGPSVLGGERHVAWQIIDNPQLSRISIATAFGVPGFTVEMGPGNASVVALSYGIDTELDLDLSAFAGGGIQIEFDFSTIDLPLAVDVVLTSGSGAASASISRLIDAGLDQLVLFDLADAAFAGPGAFDLGDVDTISFTFNGGDNPLPNRDFNLSRITFVPAPAGACVLAAAAVAARRQRG